VMASDQGPGGVLRIRCEFFYRAPAGCTAERKTGSGQGERGVIKGCRRSWLTNSVLVYEPKCGGSGGGTGSQPMSTAVHKSPNKIGDLTPFLTSASDQRHAFSATYNAIHRALIFKLLRSPGTDLLESIPELLLSLKIWVSVLEFLYYLWGLGTE
jgi:hypothetical protein